MENFNNMPGERRENRRCQPDMLGYSLWNPKEIGVITVAAIMAYALPRVLWWLSKTLQNGSIGCPQPKLLVFFWDGLASVLHLSATLSAPVEALNEVFLSSWPSETQVQEYIRDFNQLPRELAACSSVTLDGQYASRNAAELWPYLYRGTLTVGQFLSSADLGQVSLWRQLYRPLLKMISKGLAAGLGVMLCSLAVVLQSNAANGASMQDCVVNAGIVQMFQFVAVGGGACWLLSFAVAHHALYWAWPLRLVVKVLSGARLASKSMRLPDLVDEVCSREIHFVLNPSPQPQNNLEVYDFDIDSPDVPRQSEQTIQKWHRRITFPTGVQLGLGMLACWLLSAAWSNDEGLTVNILATELPIWVTVVGIATMDIFNLLSVLCGHLLKQHRLLKLMEHVTWDPLARAAVSIRSMDGSPASPSERTDLETLRDHEEDIWGASSYEISREIPGSQV